MEAVRAAAFGGADGAAAADDEDDTGRTTAVLSESSAAAAGSLVRVAQASGDEADAGLAGVSFLAPTFSKKGLLAADALSPSAAAGRAPGRPGRSSLSLTPLPF
jgi:hypothetical protein